MARPAKPTDDLKTALSWCYTGLRQAERLRATFAEYRTILLDGQDSLRLKSYLWGDVHFLITAAYQMSKALQGMPSGPSLPQPLEEQVEQLRHLVEHWEDAQGAPLGDGAWERFAIRHGAPYPTPWSVTSDGSDLKIGQPLSVLYPMDRTSGAAGYQFSLDELERVLTRVLDELLQLDTEELQQGDS